MAHSESVSKQVLLACLLLPVIGACNQAKPGDAGAQAKEPRVTEPKQGAEPEQGAAPDKPPEQQAPAATCLARYELDSDRSVLAEQRRRGGAARWDDFPKRYAAAYLEPETDHPVEQVERFRIGDTPLLWFTPDFSAAVVNAAVLSELPVVDATSLEVGERVELGALTELGQGKIGEREMVEFLLEAGVIQTYVHIGSKLCLVAEDKRGQEGEGRPYGAEFSGEHVYFTNEENRDALGFRVELDGEGRMAIIGVEPKPVAR